MRLGESGRAEKGTWSMLLYSSITYVAVPGRKRTLFRRVFRAHTRVQSAVSLNFR